MLAEFENAIHVLRGDTDRNIWLDGIQLFPEESQKYCNHSPDGFNWGYGGSGPSQLALAVVLRITGKLDGYQEFKWKYIAPLRQGMAFEIQFSDEDIMNLGEKYE